MERKEYEIAGRKFYQKQIVYGQIVWLRDLLCGKKLNSMTPGEYVNLIISKLPRFLAIILLKENEQQADKVKAGEAGVLEFENWIIGNVAGEELFTIGMAVINDFFACNPGEIAILIDGEVLLPAKESVTTG